MPGGGGTISVNELATYLGKDGTEWAYILHKPRHDLLYASASFPRLDFRQAKLPLARGSPWLKMLSCTTPCSSLTIEDSSRRWTAVDERPHGPRLRGLHAFEEPQLLRRERPSRLRHARLGAVESSRFLRIEGEQRSLGGDKARRWKAAIADVFDFPITQIVSTVIFG